MLTFFFLPRKAAIKRLAKQKGVINLWLAHRISNIYLWNFFYSLTETTNNEKPRELQKLRVSSKFSLWLDDVPLVRGQTGYWSNGFPECSFIGTPLGPELVVRGNNVWDKIKSPRAKNSGLHFSRGLRWNPFSPKFIFSQEIVCG